uniref:Uncharacterized protein n=1 Tax=Anopheles stephensi TaxID=30069 RepID=A0A182YMP7_ANOST
MVLVDVPQSVSERRNSASPSKMATLGLSKVFILDKYFTELQKFWETEKKLQGGMAKREEKTVHIFGH